MAHVTSQCELCHGRKPVRPHDPPVRGLVWLCEECRRVLEVFFHMGDLGKLDPPQEVKK